MVPAAGELKILLVRKGISLCALAERIGYHRCHVTQVMNGRLVASPRFAAAVGEVLGPRGESLLRRLRRDLQEAAGMAQRHNIADQQPSASVDPT